MGFDIVLDDDDDVLIKDGDLVVGETTEQEFYLILKSEPGMWRKNPLLGYGLLKRIKKVIDRDKDKKELDTHLKLDGFSDTKITMDKSGQITDIQATRL